MGFRLGCLFLHSQGQAWVTKTLIQNRYSGRWKQIRIFITTLFHYWSSPSLGWSLRSLVQHRAFAQLNPVCNPWRPPLWPRDTYSGKKAQGLWRGQGKFPRPMVGKNEKLVTCTSGYAQSRKKLRKHKYQPQTSSIKKRIHVTTTLTPTAYISRQS